MNNGNHLSKTLRYVYLFSVYISFTVQLCVFQDKIPENLHGFYSILFFCTISSLKPTYSWTLNMNIIQSGLIAVRLLQIFYAAVLIWFNWSHPKQFPFTKKTNLLEFCKIVQGERYATIQITQ